MCVYFTDEQIKMLDLLCEFYGEMSRSRILKLALEKLFKSKWKGDGVIEFGDDADLESLKQRD
jgi:hypothetical protein